MSHLDEGLLTALLDHELEEAERRSAETHLAECGDCRRLLEEVKALAMEADGLVAAVELPPKRAPGAVLAQPVPGTPADPDRPSAGHAMPWRTLAWAASVVLAAGLGWLASDLRFGGRATDLSDRTAETDLRTPAREEPRTPAPVSTRAPGPPSGIGLTGQESASSQPRVLQERANNAPVDRRPTAAAKLPAGAARDADRPESRVEQRPAAAPAFRDAGAVATAKAMESLRDEAGFRQVDMEEAVRTLAGSMRLVDGLRPERILIGPPPRGTGTDSSLDLVRVVYQDPPGRELWLDQQRPAVGERVLRAQSGYGLLAGDTVFTRGEGGSASLRWVDQHGFRLALTGFLGADSLRALRARIH